MTKNSKISNQLKKWRKYQGMTQKELAEAVGVAPETISRWENSRRLPSLRMAFKIAGILGLKDKIQRLFSAEGEQ